jgi:hypothetical protein
MGTRPMKPRPPEIKADARDKKIKELQRALEASHDMDIEMRADRDLWKERAKDEEQVKDRYERLLDAIARALEDAPLDAYFPGQFHPGRNYDRHTLPIRVARLVGERDSARRDRDRHYNDLMHILRVLAKDQTLKDRADDVVSG